MLRNADRAVAEATELLDAFSADGIQSEEAPYDDDEDNNGGDARSEDGAANNMEIDSREAARRRNIREEVLAAVQSASYKLREQRYRAEDRRKRQESGPCPYGNRLMVRNTRVAGVVC
jgi:hypothetical protein